MTECYLDDEDEMKIPIAEPVPVDDARYGGRKTRKNRKNKTKRKRNNKLRKSKKHKKQSKRC